MKSQYLNEIKELISILKNLKEKDVNKFYEYKKMMLEKFNN